MSAALLATGIVGLELDARNRLLCTGHRPNLSRKDYNQPSGAPLAIFPTLAPSPTMSLPPVYYNNDPTSFAFSTCHKRWPTIVQNMVADVELTVGESSEAAVVAQGQVIISQLKALAHAIDSDGEITPFREPGIPGLDSYDERIAAMAQPPTWLTAPWLFSECYLYRKAHLFFLQQPLWRDYDVFNRLKQETFQSSEAGVVELAVRYQQLHEQLKTQTVLPEALEVLFREFADISLWGNATDLSLLANATLEDIKSVQGAEARKNSEKNILANDLEAAWAQLYHHPVDKANRRVDIVLDNSGFELYADLLFTLFLLDSKVTSKVVLHCKTMPWMVSDTMIKDYQITLDDLNDKTFFPNARGPLEFVASQLERYRASGALELQEHHFWTIDLDYWEIAPTETRYGGADVHRELSKSDLVIFKGDLNYRKLTGDRKWPRDTPFVVGINKLASSGLKVWSLRTCKADVCCGLARGKDEELSALWRAAGNEVGELWCSSGKWAVMSYSAGDA